MWKECMIILLPTINKQIGCIVKGNSKEKGLGNIMLLEKTSDSNFFNSKYWKPFYLYIISLDEEIKEGDWCINRNQDTLYQIKTSIGNVENWNKVIATNDSSLVFDNRFLKSVCGEVMEVSHNKSLPQIPQQFIEKYIEEYNKGNILDKIQVEYKERSTVSFWTDFYKQSDKPFGIDNPDNFSYNKLKISEGNLISIKREKKSYTREEVEALCKRAMDAPVKAYFRLSNTQKNNWIEKNI